MKRALVVSGLMALSLTAFAGKEDRDYKQKTLMPAVEAAKAKIKAACGCAWAITVDEATVKTAEDMYHVKHTAEAITEGAAGYCNDAASKKAVCQLRTLVLNKASDVAFTFKAGAGVATSSEHAGCSWDMMTHELDK